ncbi:MAG: triose-phosphate isomerase, partial [Bacteroidales bacterium]
QILSSDKLTLLMISKKLKEADPELLRAGFDHGFYCMGNMIDFYLVTASGSDEMRSYNNGITFCYADETTLKTMVRANPGYILLRKGKIIGKWSWANLPDNKKLSEFINQ